MKSAFAASVVIISWILLVVNRLCKILLKVKVKGILPRKLTNQHKKKTHLPRQANACHPFRKRKGNYGNVHL